MNSVLLVIDAQNDFIDGSLGSKEAVLALPNIIKKVKGFDGQVIFTRDTHGENYLETSEGKHLPVVHCIKDTAGWQLAKELDEFRIKTNSVVFDKPTFGFIECAKYLKGLYEEGKLDEVTLVGYCTDICVISNALLLKAVLPELPLKIDPSCCAGVTPEKHNAALITMASCQVEVL